MSIGYHGITLAIHRAARSCTFKEDNAHACTRAIEGKMGTGIVFRGFLYFN